MSLSEIVLFQLEQFTVLALAVSVWLLVRKVKDLEKKIDEVKNTPIHIEYEYEG